MGSLLQDVDCLTFIIVKYMMLCKIIYMSGSTLICDKKIF